MKATTHSHAGNTNVAFSADGTGEGAEAVGGPQPADQAAIREAVFSAISVLTRTPMLLADPDQPDCPVVFCNDAFCDATGFSREEVLGRNCRFLQGPDTDPAAVARIRDAVEARRSVEQEIYNYRKDGSGYWNMLAIRPVRVAGGGREFLFGSQLDITRRKEAELRQMRRAESLGALASGIAHEVNNLMTIVLGSVERAFRWVADDQQRELLERADWGARKAGNLASKLLSVARQRTDSAEIVDLNPLVSAFADSLRRIVPEGTEIVLDRARQPACARLDVDQLELVLLNLVRNASDAMPNGGRITVATRIAPGRPEREASVTLSVTDAGSGMAPEVAARATEAFFTTKPDRGTGLGLFLAIGFAEQWGGGLALDTSPGRGTTVALRFPRASAQPAGSRARLPS